MHMMGPEQLQQYEQMNDRGQAANRAGHFDIGYGNFTAMAAMAEMHHDPKKMLDALNPAARSLWGMGRYDEAMAQLRFATIIADENNLFDEHAIARSNMGRIEAVRAVRTLPYAEVPAALRSRALAKFEDAYDTLIGHPHLYYRYANAHHGSAVAAYAGERRIAARFITEGMSVAFRPSSREFGHEIPSRVNNRGLGQMALAGVVAVRGNYTQFAQQHVKRLIA